MLFLVMSMVITAAFLALSGQTTSSTTNPVLLPPTSANLPSNTMISPDLSALATLQAVVKSSHELNSTSMIPVLNKIREIIEAQTGANFTLRLKKITRVTSQAPELPPETVH